MSMTSNIISTLGFVILLIGISSAQLSPNFYSTRCPRLLPVIRSAVQTAVSNQPRMGASLLRLFFHDCFVNGCDGSVLLDDTSVFTGEKRAAPNLNSARGYIVIDNIKAAVERVCPGVVSCADVLAVAAKDSVNILGGPNWNVKLGRRDARTASQRAANISIPPPFANLNGLISRFNAVGLSARDLVALSGAHTIGAAKCATFRTRIHNENNLDASFAQTRKNTCPRAAGLGDDNIAALDPQSPNIFNNNYFKNLVNQKGLLHTDQLLMNGVATSSFVRTYSNNPSNFASDFAAAMIKLGDISPLTGSNGEIRNNCGRRN